MTKSSYASKDALDFAIKFFGESFDKIAPINQVLKLCDRYIELAEAARQIKDHASYCGTEDMYLCDCGFGPLRAALEKLDAK